MAMWMWRAKTEMEMLQTMRTSSALQRAGGIVITSHVTTSRGRAVRSAVARRRMTEAQ